VDRQEPSVPPELEVPTKVSGWSLLLEQSLKGFVRLCLYGTFTVTAKNYLVDDSCSLSELNIVTLFGSAPVYEQHA